MNQRIKRGLSRLLRARDLYKHFLFGILLALAHRVDAQQYAETVFRAFRRRQREKLLFRLRSWNCRSCRRRWRALNITTSPVFLGGAMVEWIPRAAVSRGCGCCRPVGCTTALRCAGTTEMSRATMPGWNSNTGVILGNLRLGFVCTSQARGSSATTLRKTANSRRRSGCASRPGRRFPAPRACCPPSIRDAARRGKG